MTNQTQKGLLAIDPSINYIGWAHFAYPGHYIKSWTWKQSYKEANENRISKLTAWLVGYIQNNNIGHLVIEIPGSRTTTPGRALIPFGQALGCIETIGRVYRLDVHLIEVVTWKGTISGCYNVDEFAFYTGRKYVKKFQHEADALGVGMYFLKHYWKIIPSVPL